MSQQWKVTLKFQEDCPHSKPWDLEVRYSTGGFYHLLMHKAFPDDITAKAHLEKWKLEFKEWAEAMAVVRAEIRGRELEIIQQLQ